MTKYSNELTVAQGLKQYFANSEFDESNYTDKWVRLPIGVATLFLPNIKPRVKAVKLHDVDHVLTEYSTSWEGECQISAYELGTGCGKYWMAWILNSQAVMVGVIVAPRKCLHAFARGRRSKGIYSYSSRDELIDLKLGELRAKTTAPEINRASRQDLILFIGLVALSTMINFAPIALIIFLVMCLRSVA